MQSTKPYTKFYPYDNFRTGSATNGQAEFMKLWWDSLNNNGSLLAQAPTGMGKTIAALAPALVWQQEKPTNRQILYLISTINQHANPIHELKAISKKCDLASLRVVDLVGKQQKFSIENGSMSQTFCLEHESKCKQMASWQTFQDFFRLASYDWFEIASLLYEKEFCPYHYLLKLAYSADVVIADYWWLGKLFKPETAVVIDEAHNFLTRSRSELEVSKLVNSFLDSMNNVDPIVQQALSPFYIALSNPSFTRAAKESSYTISQLYKNLEFDKSKLRAALDYYSPKKNQERPDDLEKNTVEEKILTCLANSDANGENYIFYLTENITGNDLTLQIRCIDNSTMLREKLSNPKIIARLIMSGSLIVPTEPESELKNLIPQFGLLPNTIVLKTDNPFNIDNQCWIYDSTIKGTYYEREKQETLAYYNQKIIEIGHATPQGVTTVFFSSYSFMQKVLNQMPAEEADLVVFETKADANGGAGNSKSVEQYEKELREIMSNSKNKEKRAYLYALYGGKLSQGANFSNNLIKTIICISLPVENVELYHKQLCRRLWLLLEPDNEPPNSEPGSSAFKNKSNPWGKAWQYAYERPAMFQILQAVGRGIRTDQDYCAFVLLDQRYNEFRWRNFLQPEPYHVSEPENIIRNFHRKKNQESNPKDAKWDEILFTLQAL